MKEYKLRLSRWSNSKKVQKSVSRKGSNGREDFEHRDKSTHFTNQGGKDGGAFRANLRRLVHEIRFCRKMGWKGLLGVKQSKTPTQDWGGGGGDETTLYSELSGYGPENLQNVKKKNKSGSKSVGTTLSRIGFCTEKRELKKEGLFAKRKTRHSQ